MSVQVAATLVVVVQVVEAQPPPLPPLQEEQATVLPCHHNKVAGHNAVVVLGAVERRPHKRLLVGTVTIWTVIVLTTDRSNSNLNTLLVTPAHSLSLSARLVFVMLFLYNSISSIACVMK